MVQRRIHFITLSQMSCARMTGSLLHSAFMYKIRKKKTTTTLFSAFTLIFGSSSYLCDWLKIVANEKQNSL